MVSLGDGGMMLSSLARWNLQASVLHLLRCSATALLSVVCFYGRIIDMVAAAVLGWSLG